MTATVHPNVTATIGSTTAPVEGGYVTLDRKAVPYARAQVTVPLTPETALLDLDPRNGDRVIINGGNTGYWVGHPDLYTGYGHGPYGHVPYGHGPNGGK